VKKCKTVVKTLERAVKINCIIRVRPARAVLPPKSVSAGSLELFAWRGIIIFLPANFCKIST
jgi:hypothetical protein